MRLVWLLLVVVSSVVVWGVEGQGTCRCFFRVGQNILTDKNLCEARGFCNKTIILYLGLSFTFRARNINHMIFYLFLDLKLPTATACEYSNYKMGAFLLKEKSRKTVAV